MFGTSISFSDVPVTTVITAVTALVSWRAFNDPELRKRLLFNPYMVKHHKQYERIPGHALIHGSWMHLLFNAYVFYEFGKILEFSFSNAEVFYNTFPGIEFWGKYTGHAIFFILYLGGILFATLPAMKKHGDNPSYNSLGASGGVSAVLLAFIILFPLMPLTLIIFPFFGIPAFIMGILFFVYERYMEKRGGTGIAHDAHIYGALFGLVFILTVNYNFGFRFLEQISSFFVGLFN